MFEIIYGLEVMHVYSCALMCININVCVYFANSCCGWGIVKCIAPKCIIFGVSLLVVNAVEYVVCNVIFIECRNKSFLHANIYFQ